MYRSANFLLVPNTRIHSLGSSVLRPLFLIVENLATCMSTVARSVPNSGLIQTFMWPIIMAMPEESYGRLNGSPATIWSICVMNETDSASVLIAPPRATHVTVTDDTLTVDLEDGRTISVPIGWFPRLAHGTEAERSNVEIAGAGFGVYWPDLDEDIGVEGLLVGRKSTESPASFARWLEQRRMSP